MQISPQTILSGLGTLNRREMCDILALFEDTTLLKRVSEKINAIVDKGRGIESLNRDYAFEQLGNVSSDQIERSKATNRALRFQLWCAYRSAFDLDVAVPLSTRIANTSAAELAQCVADYLHPALLSDEIQKSTSLKVVKTLKSLKSKFISESSDFTTTVNVQARRLIANAALDGKLSNAAKSELLGQLRLQLETLPPELCDATIEHAIASGDAAMLTLLASGSSLVGLGVAVNMAGFSAYVFAAQASAVISLVSGPALVSTLFVLANPFFIIPALIAGTHLTNKKHNSSVRRGFASTHLVNLSLRGLAAGAKGLCQCLDDFKNLTEEDLSTLSAKQIRFVLQKLRALRSRMNGKLPLTPWQPEALLAASPQGEIVDALERALFPSKDNLNKEAMWVGGLTIGDIVYHAAAIDPAVLKAADFSRIEDLSNIFNFGTFAKNASALADVSQIGFENNLRGYVAEQLVAARLVEQGFQVTFPDISNNPGFDFLVDGNEFQVKCLSDLSGLHEHFKRYPNMPVFANAELQLPVSISGESWSDKVHFVENYDFKNTNFITETALDGGAAIGDIVSPIFAIAVSSAKNIHGWWKGSIPLKDLPFETVMRSALKGTLTAAGGFTGNAIGWLAFGPAGGVVFGGVGGVTALFGSNWTQQQINQLFTGEWVDKLDESTERFRSALKVALTRKIEILIGKVTQISAQDTEQSSWFNSRLLDNALTLEEYLWELDEVILQENKMTKANSCLRIMTAASVHPWSVRKDLLALLQVLSEKPKTSTVLSDTTKTAINRATSLARTYLKK